MAGEDAILRSMLMEQLTPSHGDNDVGKLKEGVDAWKESFSKNSQSLSVDPRQFSVQSEAVGVAVLGLTVAYGAVSSQLAQIKQQKLDFSKDRQAGIATFVVPKVDKHLWPEQKSVRDLMSLVKQYPLMAPYLGIQSSSVDYDKAGVMFYSVVPFYHAHQAMPQPLASMLAVDHERVAINTFFKSDVYKAILQIDEQSQLSLPIVGDAMSFGESIWYQDNYLNDLRAPRFFMMCLSNLLWNLQYPVHEKTGFQLSVKECVARCRNAMDFINDVLNDNCPPQLSALSTTNNQLISIVRKIEIHIKALHSAYVEQQLNELNVSDLVSHAHHTLRIMNQSLLKLIYLRQDPLSHLNRPDDTAADQMAHRIYFLNEVLGLNEGLMHFFEPYAINVPVSAQINRPPQTLMDMLIIFCHLSELERQDLLQVIRHSKQSCSSEFADELLAFSDQFISPMNVVCEKEFDKENRQAMPSPKARQSGLRTVSHKVLHFFHSKPKKNLSEYVGKRYQDAVQLAARRLLPLMTLVIEDYRLDLNIEKLGAARQRASNPHIPNLRTSNESVSIMTGAQQVQSINQSAASKEGYYQWTMAPFLGVKSELATQIDQLPHYQYQMTQLTKLLDNIGELVENYRSFLQDKTFQTFFIDFLKKIKEKYVAFDRFIEETNDMIGYDERMNRSLKGVLGPMTVEIDKNLDAFTDLVSDLIQTASTPLFTEQQKELIQSKMAFIDKKYTEIFTQSSGLANMNPAKVSTPVPACERIASEPALYATNQQIFALHELVERCRNGLSWLSYYGHKGQLLEALSQRITEKEQVTPNELKLFILELARLTAAYRQTSFFQADYGQTRSAKILIEAIQDPELNQRLPLAAILCPAQIVTHDDGIIRKLEQLRDDQHWVSAADDIAMIMPI